ncbi:hypothetical protein ABB37_06794 [Leptomonas pyrrhocoris]|uniref:Uncharacterized protein n=1 Tax=Leptomonas pyrrhocoris TaxID=157538 RepID=A0A0M9FXF1_LEPPY|nr:hypothetical protein ABB37_06794 [Leptomonas pyrrhocoris]KPA78055.1 hypothetical protein ABB37_06794 [Leptomonas pyrrhocoris]|eukprot:XP_015656494.1 hypothetical protein ABB37_06794 [Leptomonas pyrrhocoris]
MHSRLSAFDVAARPPDSYAYVHAKSDQTAAQTGRRSEKGSSLTADSLASQPSKSQTVVSVDGETAPIAAAPAAVRRVLQHSSLSSTGSSGFPSSSSSLLPTVADIPRPEHTATPDAAATHFGAAGQNRKEHSTQSLTPAERHTRRERLRQTRQTRAHRRLERAEQSSGSANHPCRIQGGCRHVHSHHQQHPPHDKYETNGADTHVEFPGGCPYRHFPAHYCVTQLREGRCSLHDVGCCPWTHSDVSEGVGRSSSSAFLSSDARGRHARFSQISPLTVADAGDDCDALQQSSDRVGQLLRLCVDAVVAAMEGAAEEHRQFFLDGTADLSLLWRALHAAQSEAPAAVGDTRSDDLLRIETLKGETSDRETASTWLALSASADLAWCAMATEEVRAEPSAAYTPPHLHHHDADNGLTDAFYPATLAPALTPAAEAAAAAGTSPMAKEELVYWSSFFTYHSAAYPVTMRAPRGSASVPNTMGAGEGTSATSATSTTAVEATPRLCLTPCISAWVLHAAAAQLRTETASLPKGADDADHRRRDLFPAPTSARVCFQHATLYLLGWRRKELRRFLRGGEHQQGDSALTADTWPTAREVDVDLVHNTSTPLPQPPATAAATTSPRWAPVLFLRDVLMAAYVTVEGRVATTAVEEMAAHLSSFEEGDGVQARDGESVSIVLPSDTRDSLLSVFLNISAACGEQSQDEVEVLVRRGSFFSLQRTMQTPTPTGSAPPTSLQHGSHSAASAPTTKPPSSRSTPSSAVALRAAFEGAWTKVHRVVLQLQWGLLRCEGQARLPVPDSASVATSSTLLLPSALSLSLYLQPALLHIVSAASSAFALRYESELRRRSGWQLWTNQQLFVKEHAAVYNGAAYARHYQPVAQLGLRNSLLNSLLLLSTRHANAVFGLETSDVRQLLFAAPPQHKRTTVFNTTTTTAAVATRWWATAQQSEHRFRQQHLQPFISLSLGFLTALQELSRYQLSTQQSLVQAYEQRRTAHELAGSEDRYSHGGKPMRSGVSSDGGGRTRKYHTPSHEAQQEAQRRRVEELRGVPLLDRLLPYGSATVSPDAAASLLRQLLEGGHPYKALKLAASIVHASRMLRHADRQPRPVLQQGYRTVHTRIWSRRALRHVLVKKKVPVLRLVGDVEGEGRNQEGGGGGRPGATSRCAVRPVGLVFALSPRVAVEVARVGLRMGEAGAALVDGVQQDCVRGALVDFTEGRGLPVPSLADMDDALQGCVADDDACEAWWSVPSKTHSRAGDSSNSFDSSGQRPTSNGQQRRGNSAGSLLQLLGVGEGRSSPSSFRRSSLTTSLQEEEWMGARHRRIAPTPLLLEVLQGHTPPSDAARHTNYLRLLLQDVQRFSTWRVLFTLQYQACDRHSRYATARLDSLRSAARAMQTVYVITTAGLGATGGDVAAASHFTSSSSMAETSSDYNDGYAVQRRLAQEAAGVMTQVLEWVLSDPSSISARRRHGAANSPVPSALSGSLRVKDVKSMLSHDVSHYDGSLASEEDAEDAAEGQQARRARLQLPVLLHHIWTTSVEHRSATQRCTALWSICAATLLGTSAAALRHAVSNGRAGSSGSGGGSEDDYLGFSLHHSYVAAGVQMRAHAPQQSAYYVDATVRALLLSPALQSEETAAHGGAAAAATSDPEWPMLLSSARTPTVSTLREFLLLQLTLLTSLLEGPPSVVDGHPACTRESMQTFVNSFTAVHGALPVDAQNWPAWRLWRPMLRHPAVGHRWLLDALLHPSPSLLVWLVAAVARTEVESYAMLRTWLRCLPAASGLTAELRQALLRETERRHRGALRKRQREHRHGP